MMKWLKWTTGILLLTVMLPFQNCTVMKPGGSDSPGPSSKSDKHLGAGGQPYDGKVYVVHRNCGDGTVVDSRILLREDGKGILYRDNCETGVAREISASDIVRDVSSGTIRFNNREYSLERPAIPLPGVISWLYQLAGTVNSTAQASIYIIDMFDTTTAKIQQLKDAGHTVICMISAGTVESWRPDANQFPQSVQGRRAGNNEKWIDTRSPVVRSLMLARLDLAKSKGCHGIDFDSVDGFSNNTGFPLNSSTQLEYNQYLAFAAHDRELILALNNVPELAHALSPIFDFAIAEECFRYKECGKYSSFVSAGKPVLVAEYGEVSTTQCQQASEQLLSLSYLDPKLDGSRYEACP